MASGPTCEAEILGTLNMDCACCICFQPPRPEQAVVVVPCNHLFCSPCLTQAMQKKTECPVDRASIDGAAGRVQAADESSLALIRGVGVQCSARRHGCTWEGTWGDWVAVEHGLTCTYRGHDSHAVCGVAGCPAAAATASGGTELSAAGILPPTDHESTYLFEHVRLLSRTVKALEEQNRSLRWELDQVKERLYSAQNDISDWQHATRRERDEAAAAESRFAQQLDVLTANTRPLFPSFLVPGVSTSSLADDKSLAWDENCCSRSAAVDQGSLVHTGVSKGWATGFARDGVRVKRGTRRTMVRFQVSNDVDDGSQVPSSAIMIGLAVHRPTTSISATQHVGSITGCWAYQGSGFIWDGSMGLCGQLTLSGASVEEDARTFGPGDIITLTLDTSDDLCTILVSKQRDTTPPSATVLLGVGGTISLRHIEEIILYPVASLGAPRCRVTLQ